MIYPQEGTRMGIFLGLDGCPIQYKDGTRFVKLQDVVVMYETGWLDIKGTPLFEGDVVQCSLQLDMEGILSYVQTRGVVQWEATKGHYFVHLPQSALVNGNDMPISNVQKLGDIYQNQNLTKQL